MHKISIAIVGLGYWGPNWLRNFATIDVCEVRYGCDLSADRCKKFAKQYPAIRFTTDFQELLNDKTLDAVVIATPTSSHFPLAKAALQAGKHVLVEKPMTSTSAEAKQLVAIAKRKKKMLLVDHTFAYSEAVSAIRRFVDDGKLGQPLYFDSTRINLGLIQKDTNVIWDLAIHDLTILDAICKLDTVQEIFACGSAWYGKQSEVGHLHLSFKNGLHAHIHVSWLSPVKIRQTLIGGKKAMIVYDDTEPSEKLRYYDKGIDHDTSKPDPFSPKYRSGDVLIPALPLTEALGNEARHFLECINGKEKPIVSGDDGQLIIKILESANLSLQRNAKVRL